MLFVLSNELLTASSDVQKTKVERAVKYIATAVFESKHLLSGSLEVLGYFKEIFCADSDLYSLFSTLENNFYSTSFDFITRKVEMVIDVSIPKRIEEDIEIFQVSVDDFQDSARCQKTIVLGEDFNDCNFFNYILNWYLKRLNFNIHCEFDKDNGGGVNIQKSINNHLKNNKILFSIIDTDRRYPNGPVGKTYEECKKYINKEKGIFKLIALDVQEIENLMPFNFLDNKVYSGEHAAKKVKFDLLRLHNPNLLQYFDIKKGIKKEKAEEDILYKNFAKECCNCDSEIVDFEVHYGQIANGDYVYPPFSRILNLIEEDLKQKIDCVDLLDFQEQNWIKIAQNMINFTCARNKEALN